MTDAAPATTLGWRPRPGGVALGGVLIAMLGWLLPWFQVSDGYSWSFSGWEYLTLTSGPGWTVLVPIGLVASLLTAIWIRGSAAIATIHVTVVVATTVLALMVIAASFTMIRTPSALDGITTLPFNIGIPVLVIGLGLALAGGIRQLGTAPVESPQDAAVR